METSRILKSVNGKRGNSQWWPVLAFLLILFLLSTNSYSAMRMASLIEELGSTKHELSRLQSQIANLTSLLAESGTQMAAVDSRIADAGLKVAETGARLTEYSANVEKWVLRSTDLARELEELATAASDNKKEAADDDDDKTAAAAWPKAEGELQEYVMTRKLPLGWNSALKSDVFVSPVGHSCFLESNKEWLREFMEYEVGGECPDDEDLAQKLLLHGCEPLPRRRCRARVPQNYTTEPSPFSESAWRLPPDDNMIWTAYSCKSFDCLNSRSRLKIFSDCLDCFHLDGKERSRWVEVGDSNLNFVIDDLLAMKNNTIRIGLDIGGGTGSFAVRMRERGVTIATMTMNLNGPFSNFVAERGVLPLLITVAQRLPFHDNTLDLVHSMHVLSNWLPGESLDFLLHDIYRVLRPGGVFWLDRFFCRREEMNETYAPMIQKLGFRPLRWVEGKKFDRGPTRPEAYLSALLEKPMPSRPYVHNQP